MEDFGLAGWEAGGVELIIWSWYQSVDLVEGLQVTNLLLAMDHSYK